MNRQPPLAFYEGAAASRNPYASLLSTAAPGLVVGPTDIATGRFGWADPVTGEVSNTYTAGFPIGIVIPRFGLWSLGYCQFGVWYVRSGKPITLAARGDFYVRFSNGAMIGQPVYADPLFGQAYTQDGGGYQLTTWMVITNAHAGGLGIISQAQDYH
jgi:hypothetical protein